MASDSRIFYLCMMLHYLLPTLVFAQPNDIKFEHLTLEDGLSNKVYTILQDSRGFLWFGTFDGLKRYDGYSFKHYYYDPADSNSISGNIIVTLLEDRSEMLWAGTFAYGLNRFNREKETFIRYIHDPDDSSSIGEGMVRALCEDREGTIWVGTYGGGLQKIVFTADSSNRTGTNKATFIHFRQTTTYPNDYHNQVFSIYEDHSGILWVGTGKGLFQFDRKEKKFIPFENNSPESEILIQAIVPAIYSLPGIGRYLQSGSAGTNGEILLIGTTKGLFLYDKKTNELIHYENNENDPASLSYNKIWSVIEDRSGNIWIGTYGGGLDLFHPATGKFAHYQHDSAKPHSLSNNIVMPVFADRSGAIWVGTFFKGVNKFNLTRNKFKHYHHNPADPQSLSSNSVNNLYEDKSGAIWVSTTNGLNKFDPATEQFSHYFHDPANPNSISSSSVSDIYEDENGIFWIGTTKGLDKYDPQKGRFIHYTPDISIPYRNSHNSVIEICEDRYGKLWAGTMGGGLNRFDKAQEKFLNYMPDREDPYSLSSDRVWTIFEGSYGRLWIGTEGGGLNRYQPETGHFIHYKHDLSNPESLSNNRVYVLFEDTYTNLWIGTGNGLCKLNLTRFDETGDPNEVKFQRYYRRQDVALNNIKGIISDNSGNLWISTQYGLARFNTRTKTFKNYDASDGLPFMRFTSYACRRSKTGELFFGGEDGFIRFHPDSIKENFHIPPIVITDFKLFNKTVNPDTNITLKKQIVLSYQENFFSFEFSALDFLAPDKNQYAFMLDGFDDDWIYSGNRRYANYTNVAPGKYTFRVKGSNNIGIWNEEGASIRIIITPPFWQTRLFKVLVLLLLCGIVYLIYRYRVNKLLELERMRIQIASDLHDDIGSTLTKITVHSEIIQTTKSKTKINSSAQKIGDMGREVVTTLSDIVWSIDARNDTFGDLLDRMRDFTDSILPPDKVQVSFQTNGLNASQKLPQATRQNIYLIFKEAVNNIAKHTEASRVAIELHNSNGKFLMVISDDGGGINENRKRSSHGIRNMQMRAERIGGKVKIESENGVRVVLTVKAI